MRFFVQFKDHSKHEAIKKIVTPSNTSHSKNSTRNFHTTLILSFDNETPLEDVIDSMR